MKIPERRQVRRKLWTYFTPCSSVSFVNFEHVIAGWGKVCLQRSWKQDRLIYEENSLLEMVDLL